MAMPVDAYVKPKTEIVSTLPMASSKTMLWPGRAQHDCKLGTLVETSSGAIIASWYGGNEIDNPAENNEARTKLWLARYEKGSWSAPQEVYCDPKCHVWNPVLMCIDEHNLALFFRKFPPISGKEERTFQHLVMYSADDGKHWSEPVECREGTGPVKCSIHLLKDGSWLCPTADKMRAYLARSTDQGKTWPRLVEIVREEGESRMTEPCLIPDSQGNFKIFLRNRQLEKANRYLMTATYNPNTAVVTKAIPTLIPNPDSGVDGIRLADGRMLLVANASFSARSRLSLFLSSDDGKTWNEIREIEAGDGDISQPSIMQAQCGSIHILYARWIGAEEKNIVHQVIDLKQI